MNKTDQNFLEPVFCLSVAHTTTYMKFYGVLPPKAVESAQVVLEEKQADIHNCGTAGTQ